jgi:hypothetical protein
MRNPRIVIFGHAQERRTEAERSWAQPDGSDALAAVVYETAEGWTVNVLDPSLRASLGDDFTAAVDLAKARLGEYPNRLGEGVPAGLTLAGLSLWLTERADGTAMGRPV